MENIIANLTTEQVNKRTEHLDQYSTLDILRCMNEEDQEVPLAVSRSLAEITKAVDCVVESMQKGGRLFYIGAGTSGRLGVLDAYECPPTFGTDPELVQAIIAGGESAHANEEAEDDREQGAKDLLDRLLTAKDVVVGIAASGRTPYVIGALQYAKTVGAAVIALTCNKESEIGKVADIAIEVVVGPEILTGSTRLKSGTAQKMVLNMISTAAMIKQGKVYKNLMVDLQVSNKKLQARCRRIIKLATASDDDMITRSLEQSGQNVKVAIVMLLGNIGADKAAGMLAQTGGRIRDAVQLAQI